MNGGIMNLNEIAKKEIIYFITALTLILPILMSFNNWLNTEDVYIVSASTAPTTQPPASETKEQEEVVDIVVEDLNLEEVDLEILQLIGKYFNDNDFYIALRIAHCESRLNQNAIHINKDGTKDVGLFQINEYWHGDKGDIYDLEGNIEVASEIYKSSGWNPWVCWQLFGGGW